MQYLDEVHEIGGFAVVVKRESSKKNSVSSDIWHALIDDVPIAGPCYGRGTVIKDAEFQLNSGAVATLLLCKISDISGKIRKHSFLSPSKYIYLKKMKKISKLLSDYYDLYPEFNRYLNQKVA